MITILKAIGKFFVIIFGAIWNVLKKIGQFYKKRKVPILICALAVLIVVLILALLLGAGIEEDDEETKYEQWMRQLKSKDIMECDVDVINDFFDQYFLALSEGDTTTLEAMYDDPLNANITTELSSIVESYSDIEVYVTPGINSGEVAVFVHYYINFVNISSAAPAVDSFYIMMDSETDSVYILTSMYTDSDINTFLYLASYREPIRSLLSDTEEELNEKLEEDADLRNIYIIMSAMAEEDSEYDDVQIETNSTAEEESETETQQ